MTLTKHRILCVEDDPDTGLMLAHLLDMAGYEVRTVRLAQEALELAHREAFSLYILDMWLGQESGLGLIRKLRAFDPDTPIILYSGSVLESDKQEALRAGATAFAPKPYIRELLETVNRLLTSEAESSLCLEQAGA